MRWSKDVLPSDDDKKLYSSFSNPTKMIPAIRNRIDQANQAVEHERGNGDHDGHRVQIPPEEIEELSELRKRINLQRAREERDAQVAGAKAMANQIQEEDHGVDDYPQGCIFRAFQVLWNTLKATLIQEDDEDEVDNQRAFGLPQGMEPQDIWEKILNYIDDPEDMCRIAPTCQLFWNILKEKYKAVRLTQVVHLISQRDALRKHQHFWQFPAGDLDKDALMSLRCVCHSSKIAVDTILMRDSTHEWWFSDSDWIKQWVPKPEMVLNIRGLPYLNKRLTRFMEMRNIPLRTFPLKVISYYEPDEQNHPELIILRNQFKQLLGFVGSSIMDFHFKCCDNNIGAYNQLKSWIVLMPNMVELHVQISGEPIDSPAFELQLQPFPSCSSLKRFTNHVSGFKPPFLAEIFRANPGITCVMYNYREPRKEWEQWDVQEFGAVLNALDMLQMERFILYVDGSSPPLQFFEFRFGWPLKHLTLTVEYPDELDRDFPSRTVFAFMNSFRMTLEELTMEWKIHDTGGFLDLPKLTKLSWKFWPEFSTFDFMVALERLQELDVNIESCRSLRKESIIEMDLPRLYPRLRKIHECEDRVSLTLRNVVWKS